MYPQFTPELARYRQQELIRQAEQSRRSAVFTRAARRRRRRPAIQPAARPATARAL